MLYIVRKNLVNVRQWSAQEFCLHFEMLLLYRKLAADCMPFPLQKSPTASDFWFRNASEFSSMSARCLDAPPYCWR